MGECYAWEKKPLRPDNSTPRFCYKLPEIASVLLQTILLLSAVSSKRSSWYVYSTFFLCLLHIWPSHGASTIVNLTSWGITSYKVITIMDKLMFKWYYPFAPFLVFFLFVGFIGIVHAAVFIHSCIHKSRVPRRKCLDGSRSDSSTSSPSRSNDDEQQPTEERAANEVTAATEAANQNQNRDDVIVNTAPRDENSLRNRNEEHSPTDAATPTFSTW